MNHYNRQGQPISMEDWAKSLEKERRVAQELLPDGKWVSTVWLGLDHNFLHDGPPLIFETMVFPQGDMAEIDMDRYSTEAEALAGHKAMVEKWSNRPQTGQ
jgi:hypothetical protein